MIFLRNIWLTAIPTLVYTKVYGIETGIIICYGTILLLNQLSVHKELFEKKELKYIPI